MQVEFTSVFDPSKAEPTRDNGFPVAALLRHAGLIEDAEIDRMAVAQTAGGPHFNKAAFIVLENAPSLGSVLTHRAGDLSPESAAEQFGLFDQLSRGQLTVRVEPPSSAPFAEKHNAHELLHESFDEYLTLLKRLWASDQAFDFEGRHHRVSGGHVASKPFNRRGIPLILGGQSGTAVKIAAKHADVFSLTPAPITQLRQEIARVRAAALTYGRADKVALSLSVRTVIASSGEEARGLLLGQGEDAAQQPQRLVGTADQVALQLIALIDLGITDFVLHGLQDEAQLEAFAAKVAPLVRKSAEKQQVRGLRELLSGSGRFGIYPGGLA